MDIEEYYERVYSLVDETSDGIARLLNASSIIEKVDSRAEQERFNRMRNALKDMIKELKEQLSVLEKNLPEAKYSKTVIYADFRRKLTRVKDEE